MIDIHSFEPLWGAWKIDKLLGSGSYGSVYKAVRREYGQEYWAAIKHVSIPMSEAELQTVYDEGLASDERSARMYYEQLLDNLQEEIQFMCRLKGNTNIVAYEDHLTIPKQEMPGYDIFIRMELLRGLNDIIRTNQLTTAEVCRLGIDICKALELLEREGIVHRDIKPANILRNSMGNYKLGDFGVAKQLEHTHTIMSKKGTYTYMAPEVFKGETASARADIYSLGLVMHRLLNNNKAPFIPVDATHISHTQSEEALMRRMKGAVLPAPVMADAALAEIIGIACAYKPEERFQTAEAFRMALEGYYKNELCSDQPVIVDVPEQKRPENIVEKPHNGEEETPRMIEPTEKLFGGDTTKGGTKPEPVLEPEREYHSDEDGETEADEPVDNPSSLVKRILIGAAAVAAVGLIFALPRAQEADAGEENAVVYLDAEEPVAMGTPVPAPGHNNESDTFWAGIGRVRGYGEVGVAVRVSPDDGSLRLGSLDNCEKIRVIFASKSDWCEIEYNGSIAYVPRDEVQKIADENAYNPVPATITGNGIHIRAGASLDAEILYSLDSGTMVGFIKDAGNGYSMIEYDGKIVYVASQYLDKE